ncbi:MAG: hypothetical protein KF780_11165 [Sphingomonas sp.]|nr:hypothetical protein [Sphingomonas sp.]
MKILLCAAALTMSAAAIAQTDAPAQAPERDARGIPVVSTPATAPGGANQPFSVPPGAQVVLSPNQQQVFTPQPAQGEMPPCTREVTDRCTQTYERSRTRAPRS